MKADTLDMEDKLRSFKHQLQANGFILNVCKILFLSLILSISACSETTPTEKQAKEILISGVTKFIFRQHPNFEFPPMEFKLSKSNGRLGEQSGQKVYEMEFDAEIIFPKGLDKKLWLGMYGTVPAMPPGGSYKIPVKTITFEETENGWQGLWIGHARVNG